MSNTDTEVKVPKSWADLKKPELVAAAEFFGSDSDGTVEVLLARLAEDGISWEDYLNAFYPDTNNEPVEDPAEEEEEVTVAPEELVTRPERPALANDAKYLIRMDRENPYFEWRKYKFTQERPFAIMPAKDAQEILTSEEGFRQAYPSEIDEYYS